MPRRRSVKSKRDFDPNATLIMTMCITPGCGFEERVDDAATGIICSNCVMKLCINLLSEKEKLKLFGITGNYSKLNGKPRGWRWMNEFVDKEGNVYHKGVEQLELKGSKPITDVVAIKAKQRANKEERLLSEEKKLLKMAAEKKEIKMAIKKQKDFLDHKIKK